MLSFLAPMPLLYKKYDNDNKNNEILKTDICFIHSFACQLPIVNTTLFDKNFYQTMANFIATKFRIHNNLSPIVLLNAFLECTSTLLIGVSAN